MRKNLAIVTLAAALAALAAVTVAQSETELPEGAKPYTPTRMEWLCLYANANFRPGPVPKSRYSIRFAADEPTNTIVIVVDAHYLADSEQVLKAIASAKSSLQKEARRRGWDSWMKIRTKLPEPVIRGNR